MRMIDDDAAKFVSRRFDGHPTKLVFCDYGYESNNFATSHSDFRNYRTDVERAEVRSVSF